MPTPVPRILAFAGSARAASFNKKLVHLAAGGATAAGAEVTEVDLNDYPMPLYHGDVEAAEGQPEKARRLGALVAGHDGLLIAAPEDNGSTTPSLKNTIDWVTRLPGAPAFAGRAAAVRSASPGGLGGLRGLVHLRAILGNLEVLVLPETRTIRQAHEAFDEDGRLKEARQQQAIEALGARLAEVLARLGPARLET